jgi:DNA mismatch repair protein MutS
VGAERFTTPELKEYETKVLEAEEKIVAIERRLFGELRQTIAAESRRIRQSALALAELDLLLSFAHLAALHNYCRPQFEENAQMLEILEGRHPVIEQPELTGSIDRFVPNDLYLGGEPGASSDAAQSILLITGPNMGGKSTYLRQTALICLMAQAGSFVPAREAKIPLIDRVFARVGASDNIAKGHSTFMVEMQETANILHSASSRSLVVLDEIGRGTATFDGLSIAWAVAEYLATNPKARPKTLFATHYHELTDLADATPGVVNFHVSAREWKDDIVFLHKIVPGRSDRSYGIQVARLAGLPKEILDRAKDILAHLEKPDGAVAHAKKKQRSRGVMPTAEKPQMDLL